MFNLNQVDKSLPKYLQLAEVVRKAIRNKKLLLGDVLPPVKSLSEDLKLNRHTVMKSFAELIAEGWLESKERVGYKVNASQLRTDWHFLGFLSAYRLGLTLTTLG